MQWLEGRRIRVLPHGCSVYELPLLMEALERVFLAMTSLTPDPISLRERLAAAVTSLTAVSGVQCASLAEDFSIGVPDVSLYTQYLKCIYLMLPFRIYSGFCRVIRK
jgi:hypothetical protein